MAGPRWVKLDVEYFGNPKVVRLSSNAKLLHLASICWAGAMLSDGQIPVEVVSQLCHAVKARQRHVDELVQHRLWYEVDGDYLIHDYTSMQDSRAIVERKRRLKAERMQRWRDTHET